MKSNSKQSGVTLVELLVVIGIATILATIGIPSYRYVTKSNRVANEINSLLGDMQFARYEAVKEGLPVQICPVNNSSTATTCYASATWSNGWIVLSNSAATGGTSIVLRRGLPFSSFNSTDTLTNGAGTAAVTFNREGFASGLGANAKFTLQDSSAATSYTRCLVVGVSGALGTAQSGASAVGTGC